MAAQETAFSSPLVISRHGTFSTFRHSSICPLYEEGRPRQVRRSRHVIYAEASPPPPPPPGGNPPSGGMPPGGSSGGKAEPPDGATLTQALELSFRNVWIRLMTSGVGKEYSNAILAFVVATIAAYKAGYSINALKLELAANEKTTTEYMGRDVSLNEQEKQTRLIWIILVYLTLSKSKLVPERTVPTVKSELKGTQLEDLLSGLSALVDSVFEAEGKGYSLETFKMELTMQKDVGQNEPITQAQANIRSQWSRIVFATLGLLPDSLKR